MVDTGQPTRATMTRVGRGRRGGRQGTTERDDGRSGEEEEKQKKKGPRVFIKYIERETMSASKYDSKRPATTTRPRPGTSTGERHTCPDARFEPSTRIEIEDLSAVPAVHARLLSTAVHRPTSHTSHTSAVRHVSSIPAANPGCESPYPAHHLLTLRPTGRRTRDAAARSSHSSPLPHVVRVVEYSAPPICKCIRTSLSVRS
jgi:hypothetical protein